MEYCTQTLPEVITFYAQQCCTIRRRKKHQNTENTVKYVQLDMDLSTSFKKTNQYICNAI
jgi:hypothetical protein